MAKTPEASVTIKVFNQEFNKEMKEMGREAGRLRQEFQLQEEQMRHSASETEKLQAKMQYLTQQQELAARRVRDTERQYAAVAAQFGENSQAAQEMARRLTSARTEEQRFANQIHDTNQALEDQRRTVAQVGDSVQEFGGKMRDAGETLSTALTLPILGVGAAAVKAADDFDSASGRLQAQLGLTKDQTAELDEVVRSLWKNAFGENIQEVSEAVAIISQQLGTLPADELERIAAAAFVISDAFGIDINESTRAAGQLMMQFGVDSGTAMDLLVAGLQRGGDYSGELMDSVSEYSTQFANLGFTAEQMMGLFVAGAESGIFSIDKLADTVKESFLQITDGGKATRDSLAELGLDYKQIESDLAAGGEKANAAFGVVMSAIAAVSDETDRNRLAIELMGTPLEDLGPQFQSFFANVGEGMTGFEGSAKQAGDALYDNFSSRLTTTLRTVQESLLPIGETILGIVEKALPAIEKMSNTFANLSPIIQQVILVIGMIAAAIGPLLVVIGLVANGIGVVIAWLAPMIAAIAEAGGLIAFLSTKFTALFAAITGPIGIVIAVVAALIAIFVALYKNNEEFRLKVNEIWASIKEAFNVALTFIKGIVTTVMSEVTGFFSSQLDTIRKFWDKNGKDIIHLVTVAFELIWNNIKMVMGIILGIFQSVWPIITNVIKVAWSFIQTTIKNAMALVMGIIQTAMQLLKGDWSGAWNTIKSTAKTIMDNIVGFFKGIDLYQIGKDIIQGLINGISTMISSVKGTVSGLAEKIPAWAKKVLGIQSPSRVMIEVGEDTGEGAVVGLENKLAAAKKIAGEFAQTFVPEVPAATGQIGANASSFDVSFARGQMEAIQNAFGTAIRQMNLTLPKGDVYLEGRVVGQVVAPYVKSENDFNNERVGIFRG